MSGPLNYMKKTLDPGFTIYRETLIRQPTPAERALGLWVDRATSREIVITNLSRLRILGQYQVVYVEQHPARSYATTYGWLNVPIASTLYMFPDTPYVLGSATLFRYFSIVFNGPLAKAFEGVGLLDRRAPLIADPHALTRQAYYLLRPLMPRHDADAVLERFGILTQLLLALHRQRKQSETRREHRDLTGKIMHYVAEHTRQKLLVGDLARRFAISPAHLRRVFKHQAGASLKKFILNARITQARQLLLETDNTLRAIADEVGFADVFHFMRTFKKTVGVPPAQFRRFQR